MKIGFVLDDSLDKTDGVQQYVLTLGAWYQTQGHKIHYLVGQTERTDLANVHSLSRNIRARFNQNRMSTPLPARSNEVKALLYREQFDVLHVQLPHSPLLAGKVVKLAPKTTAIVGTFHIIPFSKIEAAAAKLLGLVMKRNLRRFDALYSVSYPAQAFAARSFGIQTQVLPNVVNRAHFSLAKPYKRYEDDTITIVFLGRLVERKGCMHLLRAIEELHRQKHLDRVRVLICGKGPLQPELERYVDEHQLGRVVRFMGYVDENAKARYLASADIAVFPSTGGESFGIVLIEAMAAGSNVVLGGNNIGYASVLGTRPELIIDPDDTHNFAKKLFHFIGGHSARKDVLAWQQKHVKQYDVKTVGKVLLQDYERIVAKRKQTQA